MEDLPLHADPHHLLSRAQRELRAEFQRGDEVVLELAVHFDGILFDLAGAVGDRGREARGGEELVEADLDNDIFLRGLGVAG